MKIEGGTKVVHKYGFNKVLKKPFEFIYEFGYYSAVEDTCILYLCGCKNMQDSHAAKIKNVRVASGNDFQTITEG